MKIEFRFNSVNQVILIPENQKDNQLLQLCFGEHHDLHLSASPAASPNTVVIEARGGAKCDIKSS